MDEDGRENIFQIWRARGRVVPFRVRRWSWSVVRSVTVTRISEVKEYPDGRIYGKAYTEDDWYSDHSSRSDRVKMQGGEKGIGCAGSYQWKEVK